MAGGPHDLADVNARIVYWGIQSAGKTTNLRSVHQKLRPDHRGELRQVPTRIDPSVSYDLLPIELGEIAGTRTQIRIVAPPGGREHAPTRKQLLDRVDGVVFVIDSQRGRIDENLASFDELRSALAAYGRRLEDLPLVLQYNKRDLADPYALEELHRKLDLPDATVFEAVATEATGVLQTLSTISKLVIRSLRDHEEPEPAPAPVAPPPTAPPLRPAERALLHESNADELRDIDATVRRAEQMLDEPWGDAEAVVGQLEREDAAPWAGTGAAPTLRSVGQPQMHGTRGVRIPLVLADAEGRETSFVLTLSLDALLRDGEG